MPNEFYGETTKKELREFSKEKFAKKRAELVDWIKQLREIQRTDPEKAKDYLPPRELLHTFYEEMNKVYKDLPLDKEEIEEQFSSENLSRLNLNEYIALLKKVPPRFILHITRQGVRDRASFHSGRGEVSHGFESILNSGEIGSILERCLEGVITKESVRNVINNYLRIPENFPTRSEATQRIEDFLTRHVGNNLAHSEVADVSALHVSMDYVMTEEYGAERGNDIFFVYPTAFIASQYKIAAQWAVPDEFNMVKSGISGQFNDLWIKTKENNAGSMPLDASIVFIPANTQVDKNTGSKYDIDHEGVPVSNTEQIEKIKLLINLPETKEAWPDVYEKLYSYQNSAWELSKKEKAEMRDERKISQLKVEVEESKKIIKSFVRKAEEYGITDPRFHDTLLDYGSVEHGRLVYLLSFCSNEDAFKGMSEFEINHMFGGAGLTYKLADEENAITSKEYWEKYFERVGKRPSKIVFYDETDPNEALSAFKKRTGLVKNLHEGIDLKSMFAENVLHNNRQMHEMMAGEISLFVKYADEIIDELYTG
jgi:hypothetical protein